MKLIVTCDCKLCCEGSLPGIGSHLFSEFLIKETINRDGKATATGKNSRGNELLFTLTPLDSAKIFIGRQSTEDALRVLGKKEFTDDEIEDLQSQEIELIDWNLVCVRCEKLFQPVEDRFKAIYDDILQNLDIGDKEYVIKAEDQIWFELFLNLNIWRASASDKFNFRLEDHTHDCLTQLMYEVLIRDIDNRDYSNKFLNASNKYQCISVITFFDNTKIENPDKINENFISPFYSTNPYFIAVNRLLLCISPNSFEGIGLPAICKGVLDDLLKLVADRNTKVFYVRRSQMVELGTNYAKIFVDDITRHLTETYSIGFKSITGRMPNETELKEVIDATAPYITDFYSPKDSSKLLFKIMARTLNEQLNK